MFIKLPCCGLRLRNAAIILACLRLCGTIYGLFKAIDGFKKAQELSKSLDNFSERAKNENQEIIHAESRFNTLAVFMIAWSVINVVVSINLFIATIYNFRKGCLFHVGVALCLLLVWFIAIFSIFPQVYSILLENTTYIFCLLITIFWVMYEAWVVYSFAQELKLKNSLHPTESRTFLMIA